MISLPTFICLFSLFFASSYCLNIPYPPLPPNLRPIIGVVANPCTPQPQPQSPNPSQQYCVPSSPFTSYLPASYVKLVESSGGRVVPLPFDLSPSARQYLLERVNGVLVIGGSAAHILGNPYQNHIDAIVEFALQSNSVGDFFPLWGECLGLQSILVALTQNNSIIIDNYFDAENYSIPLRFTNEGVGASMFDEDVYGPLAAQSFAYLSQLPITMNMHVDGCPPSEWAQSEVLTEKFSIFATNVDRKGNEFVALFGGNTPSLPIYGSQFHIEKPIYEWTLTEGMNHTYESVVGNRYLIDFFIQQCRFSGHRFEDDGVSEVIYNYETTYTNVDFEEVYQFQPGQGTERIGGKKKRRM